MGGDAPKCHGRSPGAKKCQGCMTLLRIHDISCVCSLPKGASASLRRSLLIISSQKLKRSLRVEMGSMGGWALGAQCFSGTQNLISGESRICTLQRLP